jgi:hypothetical protein
MRRSPARRARTSPKSFRTSRRVMGAGPSTSFSQCIRSILRSAGQAGAAPPASSEGTSSRAMPRVHRPVIAILTSGVWKGIANGSRESPVDRIAVRA